MDHETIDGSNIRRNSSHVCIDIMSIQDAEIMDECLRYRFGAANKSQKQE
jgi:hypothetical protein